MKLHFDRAILLAAAVLLVVGGGSGSWAMTANAQGTKPRPCTAAEHHQFDFWLGDWDAYDWDNQKTVAARTHVDLMVEGCALREVYDQVDGFKGESFTIFDSSRQVWHHSWVTNRGTMLQLDGKMADGRITLEGSGFTSDGKPRLTRAVWYPVTGGVRETADTSLDGGKTWQPLYDMVFRPHHE